ncbi:serine hydrolase FSH, partial [Protomyces lactucae-debilis]
KAPFDGILGFSQGAACAAAITSLLDQVSRASPAVVNKLEKYADAMYHPRFKFAILFCGARPAAASFDWLYKDISTPSLHLIGQRDVMVPLERSEQLAESFVKADVLFHPG